MNTNTKKVYDVSPFLLLEASADSETYQDGGFTAAQILGGGEDDNACTINGDYDDDIESCSACCYERSSGVTWTSERMNNRSCLEQEDYSVKEEEKVLLFAEEEEKEEEEGEGEVNSYVRRCGMSIDQAIDESSARAAVVMSEIDKSRMFWEACLAS
ncbi:unnamed protein product [Cochlearia groenlandica]